MGTDQPTEQRNRVGPPEVGLGCGSLLLIALIVWLVPNRTAEALRREVQQLEQDVEQLDAKLDELLRIVERK